MRDETKACRQRAMEPDEALALARLRQYFHDRTAMQVGRSIDYEGPGWRDRRSRSYDSKLVRTLDFERTLAQLSGAESVALVLRYREKLPNPPSPKPSAAPCAPSPT